MQISVVIPTHNRWSNLSRALECLATQACPPASFEVIVVDDGSDDETWPWLQAQVNAYPFLLRPMRQPPQGPVAARNKGTASAQGELILFLGDDIYASPDLISRHMACHVTWPGQWNAVLGQVQWATDLPVTSLMHWMETGGAQWRFEELEAGSLLDYHWFITANLSLARSVLLEVGGFDEGFPHASLEDTELGYRLFQSGLQIRYTPDALAYHWHPVSLEAFLDRSRKQGRAAVHFAWRWPELRKQLLDPTVWFANYPSAQRQLLSRVVRSRCFIASLLPFAFWLARRPPGALQPWASPIYWLIVYHNRWLGITSI